MARVLEMVLKSFGELADRQVEYWRGVLDGLGESPRLFSETYRDGSATAVARAYRIPQTTVEGLRSLRSETGASLYMMLLTCFKVLFRQEASKDDVCIEARMGNRARPQLRRLVGPCANVALLRTDLGGDPTFRELLERVRGSIQLMVNPGGQLLGGLRSRARAALGSCTADFRHRWKGETPGRWR